VLFMGSADESVQPRPATGPRRSHRTAAGTGAPRRLVSTARA
jgi:hypothetical protein